MSTSAVRFAIKAEPLELTAGMTVGVGALDEFAMGQQPVVDALLLSRCARRGSGSWEWAIERFVMGRTGGLLAGGFAERATRRVMRWQACSTRLRSGRHGGAAFSSDCAPRRWRRWWWSSTPRKSPGWRVERRHGSGRARKRWRRSRSGRSRGRPGRCRCDRASTAWAAWAMRFSKAMRCWCAAR